MTTIQKLKIRGFKSFAKPTEIVFEKDFSVVLGSNGSGKSNLMDSLCFVLGKSSAKSMRAEKSSHLIFNGGKNSSPAKDAEVSIYFDNSIKEFPLQEESIKISRIIKQSGNSVYKINDKSVTRQQIIDLLSHAKIDPDGHNIILQGDIIHFTEMHPDERRKIIEDICGISLYEDKKQKALNELENVEKKLSEVSIILTERETYLRELKKERDQALKYKELEKNIKSNKATFLHIQLKEKESKKLETDVKIEDLQDILNNLNKKIVEYNSIILNKKNEIESINKEIELKSEVEQIEIQKETTNLKTDIVKLSSRLETCKNEISKIQQRKEQLNLSLQDVNNTIKNLEENKSNLNDQIKDLQKNEKITIDKINDFKNKHELSDKDSLIKIEEIEKQIDNIGDNLIKLQENKEKLLKEKFQNDAKIESLKEKINNISKLEKDYNIKDLKLNFKKISDELNKKIDEDLILTSQLQKAKKSLSENLSQLNKLQFKQNSVSETLFLDNSIKRILSLKKQGVYGTVSDLVKVPSKYKLALEVAAGSRIKSIIVENDKIAEECIKILKQNKLGTATFLPLNKIQYKIQQSIKAKGIHGFCLDLISFDLKFKNAFSYVFGSTIVVDDIQTARNIGIGKNRMVTLEGDLFEQSGAIIGGYRKKSTFSFKEKDIDDDIKKTENEITRLNDIIQALEKRKQENENIIIKFRKEKFDLEGNLIKYEKSTSSLNIEDLKKELKIIENDDINKKLSEIEKEIVSINKEISQLKTKKQNLKLNTFDLSNPQIASELEKLENKKQNIREQLIQINTELKNIDLQINNIHLPELEKTQQIIKQHDKEINEFEKESIELNKILQQQKELLKEKEKKETQFYKDYKNLFNKRSKLTEEIQKYETLISNESLKIKEHENKINTISLTRAKIIAEYESLLNIFDEFKGIELRENISLEQCKHEIDKFEKIITQMGNVNLKALEIYEDIQKEYQDLLDKSEKLKIEKEDVIKMMQEIETKKKDIFMKTFNIISENFKRIFLELSTRGEAFLELENKENPLEGGLNIKVKISTNKYLDLKSLSGGEKTLTALSFIFAIQEYQPASFYLLDEVDAALDKKNSEMLSKLINKYAQKAQYILISHNDAIISEANQIYGVSMQQNGISKIVSLKI
jgi:chromosome segregation protein